jgi:hypothetical protein
MLWLMRRAYSQDVFERHSAQADPALAGLGSHLLLFAEAMAAQQEADSMRICRTLS